MSLLLLLVKIDRKFCTCLSLMRHWKSIEPYKLHCQNFFQYCESNCVIMQQMVKFFNNSLQMAQKNVVNNLYRCGYFYNTFTTHIKIIAKNVQTNNLSDFLMHYSSIASSTVPALTLNRSCVRGGNKTSA